MPCHRLQVTVWLHNIFSDSIDTCDAGKMNDMETPEAQHGPHECGDDDGPPPAAEKGSRGSQDANGAGTLSASQPNVNTTIESAGLAPRIMRTSLDS